MKAQKHVGSRLRYREIMLSVNVMFDAGADQI
jgi:hypothetical protein